MRGQLFLLINFIALCFGGIEHIDLNYTMDKPAYDELYMDGKSEYNKGNHRDAVVYFERAVADFRHEVDVKGQCWQRCSESWKKTQATYHNVFDGQLTFLHYTIKVNSCHTLCKEKFLGRRGHIAKSVTELFERKEPYSLLQHSYFKIGETSKSLSAAFTYYIENDENSLMKEHIEILLEKLGKDWEDLRSLEELPHLTLYRYGEEAYRRKDYKDCTASFEESLTLFYKELHNCHASCEEQREKRDASYTVSLFKHFSAILRCRRACQVKLTNLDGRTSAKHFLPYYYHYLQFCYFQEDNIVEAAVSAETYLMLVPNDPVMSQNLEYYQKQPSVINKKDIEPRQRAKRYLKQFAAELNLQNIVKGKLEDIEVDEENDEDEKRDENLIKNEDEMLDNIYEMVAEEIDNKDKIRGETDSKNMVHTIKRAYRNPNRWKQHPDLKNVSLLMEEDALNGTDRVAFDDVASEEECQQIMQLVKKLTPDTNIRLIETRIKQLKELSNATLHLKLARSGDGYKHSHEDAEHPFTKKERFEGVTIKTAVDASMNNEAEINETELYLQLSGRVRVLTQEYFDMPKRLNFAFTHLVCRHALADPFADGDAEHLSHPIHSDNCLVNADGPGTCPQRRPAYTWRDYSALLYLNDDFEGGDFIFADYNNTIQTRVRPKCGRMVAFRSDGVKNLHGVLGVKKGTRCALPIWFTLSEKRKELEMDRYDAERNFLEFKLKQNSKTDKKQEL